jgi:hypothetical protein
MRRQDIAAVNLACAGGLPGGPTEADAAECLRKLDEFAAVARSFTERCRRQFDRRPGEYRHSVAYFRALCMVTALWQKCGVRYNPAKVSPDVPPETPDVFIHGPLLGAGGTCASLPVVYAAVGRRLGYPIKLVTARGMNTGHVFCRWDDPEGERVNIEVNHTGMAAPLDDDYRTGRYQISAEVERDGGYLVSLTPRRELAGFLFDRGVCWQGAGNHRRAVEAQAWSCAPEPDLPIVQNTLLRRLHEWEAELAWTRPAAFPPLYLRCERRRWPAEVPLRLELEALGLEATENLLRDPRHEAR